MPDPAALQRELTRRVRGEVHFDATHRALYSADASNYARVPIGVVAPRDVADVIETVAVCREHQAPLLPRGAGTSIAGQAVNTAVVLDLRAHLGRIGRIDPEARTAEVEPGVVCDDLCAAAARHGLTFGPDPSTHSRATLGGMIGNNSCGAHSVAYGTTADAVVDLDVLRYDGSRLQAGPLANDRLRTLAAEPTELGRFYSRLSTLSERAPGLVDAHYPDLPRRVSGYDLTALRPDTGIDLARALVGSEGTCATVLGATVRLVRPPAARALLVLGFPDMPAAADAVVPLLAAGPLAVEGIDASLVECLPPGGMARAAADTLPDGRSWLYLEFGGADEASARAAATAAAALVTGTRADRDRVALVTEPGRQRALWRIREEGAGLATRLPDGGEAWPGWEDAAVPPANLGAYLREFDALMATHHRRGVSYGHFGHGCVHVRIDFDLLSTAGVAGFRAFVSDAADLVVRHGGSLSGEHGDGTARAELLARMYGPSVVEAFGEFKAAWDPDGLMNPHTLVDPAPMDVDLRVARTAGALPAPAGGLAFAGEIDGFRSSTRRCVGVGKCVARTDAGGVMCPSYQVTRDETHSTRGRARVLHEMLAGEVITDGWRSTEVRDALDLCLSCKGCASDCPVEVDMAAYKAEFLFHHYRGRLRPRSHYSMGFLPMWARAASVAPGLANALARTPGLAPVLRAVGGITPERTIPRFAPRPFGRWLRQHRPDGAADRTTNAPVMGAPVMLWPDTFTDYFAPAIGHDAVRVLEAAGIAVVSPPGQVCCGLTWLSTGQLGIARRVLRHTLHAIGPHLRRGGLVLGLEPSCTALFRSDLTELLPDEPLAALLAGQSRTLAEVLAERAPEWSPVRSAHAAIVQTHCHQHAVLGFDPDTALLRRACAEVEVLDAGCCGLAGNFGFEQGHVEVSMACAERVLAPAVRAAPASTLVVADGFSCRTQIEQATGRRALHLAQVLAASLD